MNMNPLELLKLVQGTARSESEQLNALAAMADAPDENYTPKISLPVIDELPSFNLGGKNLGSALQGHDYGVPAPVPGQALAPSSLGSLILGDNDGR